MDMRKYNVVVREEEMSMYFADIEAASKNAACAEAIRQYVEMIAETEIKDLCAVAEIAK